MELLLQLAKQLPTKPGCYLMKNQEGTILYVGKAKSLRSRVSQYFQKGAERSVKTSFLIKKIQSFEFMLTETEAEALVLENTLIKKHRPRYNIQMRDDKTYPYVMLNLDEPFPRLHYTRRPKRGKNKLIFGPFVHGSHLAEVLRVLTKAFQLRDCSLREMQTRKRACLLYQMEQCSAPCIQAITEKEYAVRLEDVKQFFKGRPANVLAFLSAQMEHYAQQEKFEQALVMRDGLQTLEHFSQNFLQRHGELGQREDLDVIGVFQGEQEIDLSFYCLREGILMGQKNFSFSQAQVLEDLSTSLLSFLTQYYTQTQESLPRSIIVDLEEDQQQLLAQALTQLSDHIVNVRAGKRKFASFVKLARDNAQEKQKHRISHQRSEFEALKKLESLLKLDEVPHLLECYDVAIFQGSSPTAAQIVFRDGKPAKDEYRYYHLTPRPEGNNDFAFLAEFLERRLRKGNLPEVFVVDGGIQQVNTLEAVLKEQGITRPVVGIAKERKDEAKEERLILPGRKNPYFLKNHRPLRLLLTSMRDEAHRFSRKLHHKAEKGRMMSSWLDGIEGFGPGLKERIRGQAYSKEEIESWEVTEIQQKLSLTLKQAEKLYQALV